MKQGRPSEILQGMGSKRVRQSITLNEMELSTDSLMKLENQAELKLRQIKSLMNKKQNVSNNSSDASISLKDSIFTSETMAGNGESMKKPEE